MREDKIAKFHAHLDECEQCRNHPFNLCPTGDRLLKETAMQNSLKKTTMIELKIFGVTFAIPFSIGVGIFFAIGKHHVVPWYNCFLSGIIGTIASVVIIFAIIFIQCDKILDHQTKGKR